MTTRQGITNAQAAEPQEPQVIDGRELGVWDNLPFSGGFAKNELVDIRDITIDQITEMRRRDGQVRAVFRVLSLPIRTTQPSFTPREGEGSDGEEEAEFVEDALTRPPMQGGMSSPFSRVLTGMTLALADGYAVFEKVWHIAPDGRLVYRKLAPRAPKTVKFLLDDNGGLEGVQQRAYWAGRRIDVTIPARKLLIYTAQHEENPWYGESYLLPAFYHYEVKHKLYYISHLAHQFHAVPGRVGTYPQSAQKGDKDNFLKQLASMGFNTALAKPDGYAVDEFGGRGTMPDFEKMINHHDAAIAKSVLAHFIQLGTGSSTGSWALSQDQTDFFTMALEAIISEMSDTLSFYLVPQLIDYNFTTRAYPQIDLGPLADTTKEIMSTVAEQLFSAQAVNVTPEFMFELETMVADELGMEIDYEAMRAQIEADRELEREVAIATQEALLSRSRDPEGSQSGSEEEEDDETGAAVAASDVISLADRIAAQMKG